MIQENGIFNCKEQQCNFMYFNVVIASRRLFRTHRERFMYIISQTPLVNSIANFANAKIRSFIARDSSDNSSREKRAYPEIRDKFNNTSSQDLQEGERVQICTEEEIFSTLDEGGKYKGLLFMPEMIKFCGKEFKVFKKVERIMLESTGELRKLKSPTVFLDGVMCDGEFHNRCQRSCYLYWREIWLRRVPHKEL